MTSPLKLRILENDTPAFGANLSAPLELGRQRGGEPEPCALLPATDASPRRLVITRTQEGNTPGAALAERELALERPT